jgi:hypothetical protein
LQVGAKCGNGGLGPVCFEHTRDEANAPPLAAFDVRERLDDVLGVVERGVVLAVFRIDLVIVVVVGGVAAIRMEG